MKNWFKALRALILKDFLQEWHSRDILTAMLAFAVLALFIFNYALELTPALRAELAAGIIWVVLLFAGTLGLNRSFLAEQDQGCFDALLMGVPDLSVIYVSKFIVNWLSMTVLTLLVLPLYALLYNQPVLNLPLFGALMLAAWGYSAAGTLIAGMSIQTRTRDLLLPILLFPVLMPVNMAIVKAAGLLLAGDAGTALAPWMRLLWVYDVIVTVIGVLIFEYVIQE